MVAGYLPFYLCFLYGVKLTQINIFICLIINKIYEKMLFVDNLMLIRVDYFVFLPLYYLDKKI